MCKMLQPSRCLFRVKAIFGHLASRNAMSTINQDEGLPRAIKEESIEIDGQNIHYDWCGTGRHALLLLPGALGSSRTDFLPQLQNLNRDIFTLYAWDPPGYGKSRPPDRDWPVHFLGRDADVAAKLMQKLGIDKYSVVGWSDGGITGLMVAARNPQKVRKLVIWGSNAYVDPSDVAIFEGIRDIDKWSERMKQPFLELYGREYFSDQWSKWVDAYVGYVKARDGDICKDELKNIVSPTLIVHGQKDALVPQFHPDYLRANIKDCQLVNWPEGKHNLHLRYYKEFNSLVEKFLLK